MRPRNAGFMKLHSSRYQKPALSRSPPPLSRKHGVEFAVFKCDCCCTVADWDCSGNHHCTPCHSNVTDKTTPRPDCCGRPGDGFPLGMRHPPNRVRDRWNQQNRGFVVGCTQCMGVAGFWESSSVSDGTRARFAAAQGEEKESEGAW